MKVCNVCNTIKPLAEFNKNNAAPDGHDCRCRTCKRALYIAKRNKDPLATYFVAKRSWCKKRGILFDVTLEQLKMIWTGICPVLGLEIGLGADGKGSHKSAHLDRLDPNLGYTITNVNWISGRANRIKYDATLEELKLITQWVSECNDYRKVTLSSVITE